jgi:hypothetical protein
MMPLFVLGNPGFASFLPAPFNQAVSEPRIIILFVGATFLLMIPLMFLTVLVQGATTFGALEADKGATRLSFQGVIKQSLPYYWRLFGLYALFSMVWLVIVGAFMAVNVGVSLLTLGLGALCMMPMTILFMFLMIPFSIVSYALLELGQAAIVIEHMTLQGALSKAWQTFRANALAVVLLMVMLYFALVAISGIFVFPMMFPMVFLPVAVQSSEDIQTPFALMAFVFFPLLMLLVTVVQGILMAFFQSAWVVAYRQLGRGPATPVLVEAHA